MISQSENGAVETATGMSARLLNTSWRRGRGVSRLEFQAVGRPLTQPVADVLVSPAIEEDAAVHLRAEMDAMDARLLSQTQQVLAQLEAARREAREEARREWEEELEARVIAERSQVLQACEAFGKERARYFAGVEGEVVKLALAIAARVLHREARLDPLLLTAAIRVALEKVADESATVLKVPPAEVDAWRGVFGTGAEPAVQVIGDERLREEEIVLETSVGKVELGVSVQLDEIEKGFFDLLQQRPA
jgi:flagellar assembly protein FliH